MPKLIENARERILDEARRELLEGGYDALAIRSIANKCGIATGTVYNYFSSKDMLAAGIMLEDWLHAIALMERSGAAAPTLEAVFADMYATVRAFRARYEGIWQLRGLTEQARMDFKARHLILIAQISSLVHAALVRFDGAEDAYLDRFISENILTATAGEDGFAPFWALLSRVIKTKKGE